MLYTARKVSKYGFFFWSVFSHIRTKYGEILSFSVLSPNAGKYGTEETRYLDAFHAVIYQHAPRLTHHEHAYSFQDVLEFTNEKTAHQKILESLAKKIYTFLHGLSLPIMKYVFE